MQSNSGSRVEAVSSNCIAVITVGSICHSISLSSLLSQIIHCSRIPCVDIVYHMRMILVRQSRLGACLKKISVATLEYESPV